MTRYWNDGLEYSDDYLEHSWGNSPKQKAKEKAYNARYYAENKDKWKKYRDARKGQNNNGHGGRPAPNDEAFGEFNRDIKNAFVNQYGRMKENWNQGVSELKDWQAGNRAERNNQRQRQYDRIQKGYDTFNNAVDKYVTQPTRRSFNAIPEAKQQVGNSYQNTKNSIQNWQANNRQRASQNRYKAAETILNSNAGKKATSTGQKAYNYLQEQNKKNRKAWGK